MPTEFGSLSKEFPLEQIENTLRLARGGMEYAEYRRFAEARTNVELAAITSKRFLLVDHGIVTRDYFLSLVEREGLGSARMRKIMFGIWALRDSRVKRYFLEVIADRTGKWRAAALTNKRNSSFFLGLNLAPATAAKARSNVEYFLSEAGILTHDPAAINLGLSDNWLFDALSVFAQHETNSGVRREIREAPVDYLLRTRLNGIADATEAELRGVSTAAQADAEVLYDDELDDVGDTIPGSSQDWNRRPPNFSSAPRRSADQDPVSQERAGMAHYNLELLLSRRTQAAGHRPRYNNAIDQFFQAGSRWVICEIKSCHDLNYHAQVRRGVSQLFEYEYRVRRNMPNPTKLLLLESAPPRDRNWLVEYLIHLGITPAWKTPSGDRIVTTVPVPDSLAGIVEQLA
jgi:hypothetical protein